MINILVVEDETSIANLIKMSLKKAGFNVVCAYDGKEAANYIENNNYDLIILDVMLPFIDGFELMDYIKPYGIPVIFLTAKSNVEDRVMGLSMGAEDYIVKPFEIVELIARVNVVLRRYKKNEEQYKIGNVTIDTASHRVSCGEEEIILTPKEYDLLLFFVQNPNKALYRETIYERVWGMEYEIGSKSVDLHVQRLRKKVHLESELQAINKVGYRLEVR